MPERSRPIIFVGINSGLGYCFYFMSAQYKIQSIQRLHKRAPSLLPQKVNPAVIRHSARLQQRLAAIFQVIAGYNAGWVEISLGHVGYTTNCWVMYLLTFTFLLHACLRSILKNGRKPQKQWCSGKPSMRRVQLMLRLHVVPVSDLHHHHSNPSSRFIWLDSCS